MAINLINSQKCFFFFKNLVLDFFFWVFLEYFLFGAAILTCKIGCNLETSLINYRKKK